MAGPNYVLDKGFKAGGALTKYSVVQLTSPETVAVATATTQALIGVVQEEVSAADATAGRIVSVRLMGISRCLSGGIFTAGDFVTTNGTGQVIQTATAGQKIIGRYIGPTTTTTTAGSHVDVIVLPAGTPA